MTNKTIALVVGIFVLIVVGMFGFTYLQKQAQPEAVAPTATATTTDAANPYGITRIEATYFYIDGVHTLVGEIMLPTPCDLLTTESTVDDSQPGSITFDFNVLNNSESCAQVVTAQRFKVQATARQAIELKARFMGQPVELNLLEAAPGETPDEFEVFIKG